MKTWLPWKFLVRHAARRSGFIDPIAFLARFRQFAQPSEVQEPIELVRAGVIFHARGLINTKVLQNNLDWVWPYWVVRQFDPDDASFLPRAFSFSHVNLTHRNWTAVGLPGMFEYPIVDPRGLITMPDDPWSLDWWFVPEDGAPLFPSRTMEADQRLDFSRGLEVITESRSSDAKLETSARVSEDDAPTLHLDAKVIARTDGRLVLAVRPANPEGIHFVDEITIGAQSLKVNSRVVHLDAAPEMFATSIYALGDLPDRLTIPTMPGEVVHCPAGLATAAAVYRVRAGEMCRASATVKFSAPAADSHIHNGRGASHNARANLDESWDAVLNTVPQIEIPETRWSFLHAAALRTLVLLSPGEIFPGPYTYRRFWFRDACLIMNAMIAANLDGRARRALELFPRRQRSDGYFHSQEGEWDANGQVLWIADRLERVTNRLLPVQIIAPLERAAAWIVRKRNAGAAGLLPPGFSAEHLGPVDQYYWDDFWGVAGLRAIADLVQRRGDAECAQRWTRHADEFLSAIRNSLEQLPPSVSRLGIPASPRRRMDAGAIGSLVADHPLQLDDIGRERIEQTAHWLWENCRCQGGFFQDMIHSGINAYLTLALAQTFLRLEDSRYLGLIETVATLASPTGQWPEAIHPRTGGGCMGDGQHAWAAAEWILAMRALFVREEKDHLVIGSGLPVSWFTKGERIAYGPTATVWGTLTLTFEFTGDKWHLHLDAHWHGRPPRVRLASPFFEAAWLEFVHGEAQLRAVQV